MTFHNASPEMTRWYHYQSRCRCGWAGIEYGPPAIAAYDDAYSEGLRHNAVHGETLTEREVFAARLRPIFPEAQNG